MIIVTERARKLRAQYMVQVQGLRTRIELRVNRIPSKIRKTKLNDLLGTSDPTGKPGASTTATKPLKALESNARDPLHDSQNRLQNSPSPSRSTKRVRYAFFS